MSLRIRRGTDAERQGLTFDLGEIVWTTDTRELWVGDGITQGGVNPAASLAGVNLTFNTQTNKLDVSNLTTDAVAQGQNNKYFSSELAQAATASLFQNGTHTGITFVYDDSQNKINATVTVEGGGTFNLLDDTTPELGGDLGLNGNDITGTGNINVIGNIEATGTIYLGAGLANNLILNGHNITGSGNIQNTGTIWPTQGLGGNLILNSYDITGTGSVDISGDVNANTLLLTQGLGGALYLNSHNIEGTGNINIAGDITVTGVGNAFNGPLTGDVTGTLFGDVNGNLSGDVTGNINTGSIENSAARGINIGNNVHKNNIIVYGDSGDPIITVNGELSGTAGIGQRGAVTRFVTTGGNYGLPTALAVDDLLGQVQFAGTVNTGAGAAVDTVDLAVIRSVVIDAGNLTTTHAKGKLQFFVANHESPANSKFAEFDFFGTFSAPTLKTGPYTTVERDALTPSVGMIIYNSTLNKFQGYQNTGGATLEWVDLS